MDKITNQKLKKYIKRVCDYLPIHKAILFGSFARGTQHKDSDIDIAIIVDKIKGNYLEISSKLFDLVWDIDTRIEPVLIEESSDESGFLENILKTGIIIYQSK